MLRGQGLLEYALLLAVVVIGVILVVNATGVGTSDLYCRVVGSLDGEACAAPDPGCTLAFDDASELDSWKSWDAKIGNLTVEDGRLVNKGNQVNYFSACAEGGFGGSGYADFSATLDGIMIDNYDNGLHSGFDFIFRADQETGDSYWFTYSGKSNVVNFWKREDGERILLESKRVPPEWVNEELTFVVKAEGDTISAYKDGDLVIQATDDSYDSGVFAWRNKPGSATSIDGFVIQ